MTEYRIVTKLDPSGVTQGKAKVKQDLREIDTASASTRRSLSQMFSGGGIDRSINTLIGRIDALGTKMEEVARTSASVATSNATTSASLDKLGASGVRAGDGLGRAGKGAQDGAKGAAAMDSATRRVLQAVDQEAAELARLNSLLAEAKVLHERGVITSTQFARVQNMVTAGIKNQVPTLQQQRAGFMMAGQQVQDWTQQLALGINPLVVLAQQGGQTASALEMALGRGGTAGRVAAFMAGPWGSLMLAAIAVVGMMIYKNVELGNALDKEIEKLKKDAKETETTRQAKKLFADTMDGVTDALARNREALKQLDEQEKTAARRALESALQSQDRLKGIRAETAALLDQAKAAQERNLQMLGGVTSAAGREFVAQNVGPSQDRIAEIQANLAKTDAAITEADKQVQEALSRRYVELGDMDPAERIKRRYDILIEAARARAVAEGKVTAELVKQVNTLAAQRDAEVKAYQATQRTSSDGVSRFRSRRQAIGIAGRELQRGGLRVGENEQFGGVHSNHPGMGNAAHGANAIDVNSGAGVVEANVPDLRNRFNELARRYQARGYRVLWNGQVYEANGNGPSGPIRRGDQHRDHMHLEAPQSIVGKATQASSESQEIQDARREQTAAEQQRDFVQGVVDQAATRGQGDRSNTLGAQVTRTLADFQRRFNRAANDNEKKTITDALTEADQREARVHFEENYVQPLERLRALQEKTGVEREILNAKLSESARLGRELSAEEAANIEDLYRGQSDEQFDAIFVKPLERLRDLQGKVGIEREVMNAQLEESVRIGRELNPVEMDQVENSVRQSDALRRQSDILTEIRQPQLDYAARIEALNALLAKGAINQTTYNARVSELGQTARQAIADLPGQDPATGSSYADLAARADEDARFAQELDTFESQKTQLLQLGLDYDALVEAAHKRHVQNMNAIDQARKVMAITAAQSTAESLLQIAETSVGQQSIIYKALFVASKAFAIADAVIKIQQGVAKALDLPFPANLAAIAAVAAAGASIVSNIQAVSLNLRDGGLIRGPGGPRDDRVRVNASDGEYMVNAAAVARPGNLALLEALNNGATVARGRQVANDNAAGRAAATQVIINNLAGGVEFEVEPGLTMDQVIITARRVAREEAPRAVARDLRDPNSRTSKALQQTTTAGRKRA